MSVQSIKVVMIANIFNRGYRSIKYVIVGGGCPLVVSSYDGGDVSVYIEDQPLFRPTPVFDG